MTTLYWHDYETTSADPARCRVSQFAGVRTDEDLNVLGEPLMIYCKPPPDLLPSPMACLITGITPQQAEAKGLSEPDFIARVHAELSQPGTCGVGYNSIRFDDEVTRYTLYRNFYDPYEREWKNGNSRWDIIDMFRLARALRPEGIEWPNYDDGSPSFKLEELTAANGLSHESAHDALSDVMATIGMAKLLRDKQPKLYQYVYRNRTKHQAAKLVDVFSQKPFLHVSSRLPRENGYVGLMMPVAYHPNNKNEIISINLNGNIEPLLDWPVDHIQERLYMRSSELAEGEERIPLKGIHINRCPVVATPKLLDQDSARRLQIDLERCEANWQKLRDADLSRKLAEVYGSGPDWADSDVEQMLYHGFLPDSDRALLQEVRQSTPQELAADTIQFSDERYRELLFRYRARNFPDTLLDDEKREWQEQCLWRLHNEDSGYLTLEQYRREIKQLLAADDLSERNRQILADLQAWGENTAAPAKAQRQ